MKWIRVDPDPQPCQNLSEMREVSIFFFCNCSTMYSNHTSYQPKNVNSTIFFLQIFQTISYKTFAQKKQHEPLSLGVSGRAGSRQIFYRLRLLTFFQAASAPDFFPKRLRLLVFFQAAPAPRSQKHQAPAPDYWLSLEKYSFPRNQ